MAIRPAPWDQMNIIAAVVIGGGSLAGARARCWDRYRRAIMTAPSGEACRCWGGPTGDRKMIGVVD